MSSPANASTPKTSLASRIDWSVVAFLISATVLIVYTASRRTWVDIAHIGVLLVGGGFFVLMAAYFILGTLNGVVKRKWTPRTLSAVAVVGAALCAAAGVIYYSAFVAVTEGFAQLALLPWAPYKTAISTGAATLAIGLILFIFRLRLRFIYGLSEAGVGVFVASHRVYANGVDISRWDANIYLAILTAGIYLVVRGFDNMHQAWTKEPPDPFVARFLKQKKAVSEGKASGPEFVNPYTLQWRQLRTACARRKSEGAARQ